MHEQQLSNASSHHLHSHNHHHNHHHHHHHYRQHRPRQMIYPLIPIARMIDSGINAGPRSTLRGSDLRISAGITRGIDARYARRILTGGISSGWNWCLSRTRGHGYRESCIFTQLRSVARFSPEHRIARTKCRLISTDLWFIGFLPLSLPFDYANDRRVKIPGNILPPFDATNLFISRYCSSDFLFFVHRRNSWKNWILKIGEKKDESSVYRFGSLGVFVEV